MSWRDSVPSGFRDHVRFGFPSSSWASSSAFPADSGDGGSASYPQRDDGCSYTKVVKSRCFLDQNGEGRPIRKCVRTEQLLRSCIGKPQEVVESKSESTEEEVPNGWTMEAFDGEEGMIPFSNDSFPQSPSPWNPFEGRDPFSKGLSDGLESFMQAAEEMMNDVFNQLGFYKRETGSSKDQADRPWTAFPDARSKGKFDSMPAEKAAPKKFNFGDSDSFDEV